MASTQTASCPECGGPLNASGRCAPCLLGLALDANAAPVLRGYTILETLGRGGMGTVYRARQHGSERLVALKMVQARHVDDEVVRERFRSEVRLVGALSHPNILPLHESGVHDGVPFFSMQLAEGGSLAELIARDGPLAPRRAAALLECVARALHHAHQRGVLHRDLKPANILLGADGTPFVSDFGVARALDDPGAALTLTGAIVGSPGYMAPEQAAGSSAALTTAADVFGLGAILFAALTGRAPFVAETPLATMRLASEASAPRLRLLRPDLPRDLEIICAKALAPEASARYASAADFADELRRWLDGRPILARRASPLEIVWRWARRNPLPASLGLALAVFLAAGVASLKLSRDDARAAEQAAKDRLFEAKIEQARAARRSGNREEALQALAQALEFGPAAKLRDEMIGALALSAFGPAEHLPFKVPLPSEISVSPDQQRIAVMLAREIVIRALADGVVLQRLPLESPANFLFPFAPDGRHLAARSSDGTTHIWEIAAARVIFRQPGPPGSPARSLAFSPDGQRVALGRPGGGFEIRLLSDPAQVELQLPGPEVTGLAWSPDGQSIALSDGPGWRSTEEGSVSVLRTADGTSLWRASRPRGFSNLAWSVNGTVAAASWDAAVVLFDAASGAEQGSLASLDTFGSLRFSPSGQLLICVSLDDTVEIWDVRAQQFIGSARSRGTTFFPPAEDRLLLHLADGSVVWHRLQRSPIWRAVAGGASLGRTQALRASAHGEWVVISARPNARIIDLATLEAADAPPVSAIRLGADFTRDGSALVLSVWERGFARLPLTVRSGGTTSPRRLELGPPEWLLERPSVFLSEVARDGRALLSETSGASRRILLFEPKAGAPSQQIDLPGPVLHFRLSADSRQLLTAHYAGGLRILEVPSGKLLQTVPSDTAIDGEFSPDGRWLVTREAHQCVVREIPAGWARRQVLPAADKAWSTAGTAFSPDSKLLAVAGDEGVIDLYEASNWRLLSRLHSPRPLRHVHLVFARGGNALVAAGSRREAQVWDLAALRQELAARGMGWTP